MARIEFVKDGVTVEVPLDESSVLGRDESADIVLPERSCSRRHARIERRGDAWRIVDLGSANGTTVNGAEITQVRLEDGDRIEIGGLEIRFRGSDGAAVSAAPRARRRSPLPFVLGAALLLVGLLVWRGAGGDAEEPPVDAGTPEVAAADPGANETPEPDPPVDPDADVRRSFAELRAGEDERSLDDSAFLLEDLARRAQDARLEREIREHLLELEATRAGVLRLRLEEGRARADELAAEGRWGEALDALEEAILEIKLGGVGVVIREALAARIDLLGRARDAWTTLARDSVARAEAGEHDAARQALERAVVRFRGSNFEALARSELRLVSLRTRRAEPAVAEGDGVAAGTAPSAPGRPATANAALDLASRADRAAADRRWAEAASLFGEALGHAADPELVAGWQHRREILEAYGRLKRALIASVNAEDSSVRPIKVGRMSARPYSADPETIQLRFGREGQLVWKWTEVASDRLLELFATVARDPADKLDYARVAFDLGAAEAAETMLARAVKRDGVKDDADRVVARARGEEVPDGGYRVHENRFVGPEAWFDIQRREEAERLAKDLVRATERQFPGILAELEALGDAGRPALRGALRTRLDNEVARARKSGHFAKPQRARKDLLAALETRRATALELIYDDKRYPYPYAPNQAEIQAEVDGLVARVRDIWDRPEEALLALDPDWAAQRASLAGLEERLRALGEECAVVEALDLELRETIALERQGWSAADQRRIEETAVFNAEIKSSITDDERECHRLTNAYRMMMGLPPVKIDEALVLAARGHSQEMKDLGYFAHDSPVPGRERPSDRAALAGWGGGVSENIARGQQNAAAAVAGWISSSGHHRNILGRGHTHLGCGKAADGPFWTQNFGRGSSSAISKEKIEPVPAK